MSAPTPQLLAVDLVVRRWVEFGYQFLFITRKNEPYRGRVALPGGFIEPNEDAPQAAARELQEETGVTVDPAAARLTGVYTKPNRDPRGVVRSIAYAFDVPEGTKISAGDDAESARWMTPDEAQRYGLAFDHKLILFDAMALQGKDALLELRASKAILKQARSDRSELKKARRNQG